MGEDSVVFRQVKQLNGFELFVYAHGHGEAHDLIKDVHESGPPEELLEGEAKC